MESRKEKKDRKIREHSHEIRSRYPDITLTMKQISEVMAKDNDEDPITVYHRLARIKDI